MEVGHIIPVYFKIKQQIFKQTFYIRRMLNRNPTIISLFLLSKLKKLENPKCLVISL